MRARRLIQYWWQWLGLFFLGGAANVSPQNQAAEEGLRWMKLRISEVSAGVEVEGDTEKRTVANAQETTTRESFYAVPEFGLGLQGSVYHPNLLEFKLDSLTGVGWQENSIDVSGGGTRSDALYLFRYQANASILKEKPYATSLFAEREHTTRDYDFFTRATVDRESQGARVGYSEGPVPVSFMFRHTKEDISNTSRPTSLDENNLTFTANNEQSTDNRTDLNYTFNDYSRQESGAYTEDGHYHTASLVDLKSWGKNGALKLNSSLSYNQQESVTTPFGKTDSTDRSIQYFTDHEHLTWKHSRQLQSDYNYSYNQQESGTVKSDGHSASAALRHQLYESLTSTFDVHGQYFSSSGADTAIDTTRYGIGLNENYTKQLGKWGRITFGYGGLLDQESRVTSGQILSIVGETHTLSDGAITFLNQPRVTISSIQVFDATGNILYRELLDYVIIAHGELTEIKRMAGGQISNGSSVRVDYSVTSQPTDSFTTVSHRLQLRLDFFESLVGLYGYLNLQDNYGGESLVLETICDQVAGADVTWRWLRTGGEYQVYDSNLSPYRTARLYQNFTIDATEDTTFSLDVGQSWSTFPKSNRDLTTYHVIARVRLQLNPALSVTTEGGIRFQEGEGYDQQLATARANLEFKSGKLTVQAGYLYEDETFLGELRLRNYFFLRAKRIF